jgi:hypothetical protein
VRDCLDDASEAFGSIPRLSAASATVDDTHRSNECARRASTVAR